MVRRITQDELQHIVDMPSGTGRFGDENGGLCALGKGLLIMGLAQGPYCSRFEKIQLDNGAEKWVVRDPYGAVSVTNEQLIYSQNDGFNGEAPDHMQALRTLCLDLMATGQLEIILNDPAYSLSSQKELVHA